MKLKLQPRKIHQQTSWSTQNDNNSDPDASSEKDAPKKEEKPKSAEEFLRNSKHEHFPAEKIFNPTNLKGQDSANWTGFLQGSEKSHYLYYWFFAARGTAEESQGLPGESEDEAMFKALDNDKPLLLWLTGGPGCSSILALLMENGPIQVDAAKSGEDDDFTLHEYSVESNPYSWTEHANVLWLDSPVGAGFSFEKDLSKPLKSDSSSASKNPFSAPASSGPQESDSQRQAQNPTGPPGKPLTQPLISEDIVSILKRFTELFPQFKGRDFYITGESYGGHYVPSLAKHFVYNSRICTFLFVDNIDFIKDSLRLAFPII